MDWLSYFIGLSTFPALVALYFLARVLLSRSLGDTTSLRHLPGPTSSPTTLQFNRRVVGQLRHPTEAEETTARAS